MTQLVCACRPDLDAEWEHLRSLLPGRPALARPVSSPPVLSPTAPAQPALSRAEADGHDSACDVLAWARSGLMYLTGYPDGPPLGPAVPVLGRAQLLAAMIGELSAAAGTRVTLDLPWVLADRARLHGWRRRGAVSANGSARLLAAADGWLAVNLARPDDVAAVPAVTGAPVPDSSVAGPPVTAEDPVSAVRPDPGRYATDPGAAEGAWAALARHAAGRPAAEVAAATQVVGIPAAVLGGDRPEPVRLTRVAVTEPAAGRTPGGAGPGSPATEPSAGRASATAGGATAAPLFVLDLSAMWAGPLCARILRDAGWRVLKVEDSRRPDGARSGPPQFYAGLHAGIPAVRLDFGTVAGRAELARLASLAAVVIESSRPRALRRLGLIADEWLAAAPGRIWVSITGYGRDDVQQRVAFGDDAAAAGGLVATAADGSPVFCGDAIADPLTGLLAAAAALAAASATESPGAMADQGSWLLDIAMAGVCADLARPPATPLVPHPVSRDGAGWTVRHGESSASVCAWS